MTVRLRPHHLLCLLTYVGKGYSPAFVANYEAIAERLSKGEDVTIVAGPDDICAPLLGGSDTHCLQPGIDERDRLAARDVSRLLSQPVHAGARIDLTATTLARLREAFGDGVTRSACAGCEWSGLCDTVAKGGYEGTLVQCAL